jgi:hypothetical protein
MKVSGWERFATKGLRVVATPDNPTEANYSFRTLSNYVSGFALCIQNDFGVDFASNAASALTTCITSSLAKPVARLSQDQERALVRGWSTEWLLRQPLAQTELLLPAIHWAPVQAYYAVHGTSSVWMPGGGANALTHANHLRAVSSRLTASTTLPRAVRLHVTRGYPATVVGMPGSTGAEPVPSSTSLTAPIIGNCHDFAAHGLLYARKKQLEESRRRWLRDNKRKKLPSGQLSALDQSLQPTTVYDFLYQLRLRANYDDAEPFLSGGLSSLDPQRFITDLCTLVAFLNFVAECQIAARSGKAALVKLIPKSVSVSAGEPGQGLITRSACWPR